MNEALRAALRPLVSTKHLLLGVDFDGTLAPLADEPMSVTPVSGAMPALHALAALHNITVALVSGRALSTLQELTEAEESIVLIGSHGAESSEDDLRDLTSAQQHALATLDTDIHALLRDHPQARIERKPSAVVLHTRGMAPEAARAASAGAVRVAAERDGVLIKHGKDVIEMAVTNADKGTALLRLAQSVGADVIVYAGDDVTDEHAFEQLGNNDISIKVGPGDTAARYRVSDEHSVVAMIEFLHEVRTAAPVNLA